MKFKTIQLKQLNLLFPLAMCVLLFAACGPKEDKKADEARPAAAEKAPSDGKMQMQVLDSCDALSASQVITPDSAAIYIHRFWNDEECIKFGEKYGAGNYFPISDRGGFSFLKDLETDGVCFYPCVYESLFRKTIFMAMKRTSVCPGINNTVPIESNELLAQSNWWVGKFGQTARNSAADMKGALNGLKVNNPNNAQPLYGYQVIEGNNKYKSYFDPNGKYVNSGFAFTKEDQLELLLTQPSARPITGFYTLLGLDNDLSSDNIRLILIAVDASGMPLLADGSKCLEKSWPPIERKKETEKK